MIERYIETLAQLRENKIELQEFLYAEGKGEKGLSYDINATKRARLLKAMQYSRLATDELLLVELFKAEIERHKEEPFQGHYPALSLNAYLLSLYQKPAYAALFLQAKQANFDTHCGFDHQYLVSAGIPVTYEYIKKADPSIAEGFYEYVGNECNISAQELQHWKEVLEKRYPAIFEMKDITEEIYLAIEMGENVILAEKVLQWEHATTSWSKQDVELLAYYKSLLANVEGQIQANEQLMDFMTSDWDKAAGLLRLSELYLKLDDYENTWSRLKEIQVHVKGIPDWDTCGLGRFIVEVYFDLILSINNADNDMVKEAYKWSSNKVYRMENLHLNLIEKAAQAGDLMDDIKLSSKFYEMLAREKQKWDDFKNKR